MVKPMLATDADLDKVKFPCIVQPKIDGVRAVNYTGQMSARSLKPFGNRHIGLFFSQRAFHGFDGELAAESETHPSLCRLTTSATSTIEGTPWLMWHVFDYVTSDTILLPYHMRLSHASQRIAQLHEEQPHLAMHLRLIDAAWAKDRVELECLIEDNIDLGYEGTIIRDPHGKFKQGRSTIREGGLLRIKPYIEVDVIVYDVEEGQTNMNAATVNPLGHTERSTHQENMVPNGMVGALLGSFAEDVVWNGKLIHRKGEPIRVSPGRMTHDERALYLREPWRVKGARIKVQIFPHGVKDKPRHPTFQSFRSAEDTVEK